MEHIRFKRFLSEKPISSGETEAARLRRVQAQLAQMKKQRIAASIAIAVLSLTVMFFIHHLLTNGNNPPTIQNQIESGAGDRKAGE